MAVLVGAVYRVVWRGVRALFGAGGVVAGSAEQVLTRDNLQRVYGIFTGAMWRQANERHRRGEVKAG